MITKKAATRILTRELTIAAHGIGWDIPDEDLKVFFSYEYSYQKTKAEKIIEKIYNNQSHH